MVINLTHPSSMLPSIEGSTIDANDLISFSSLCRVKYIFAPTHRNRTTPNNPLKMDRLISLTYLPFSLNFLSNIDSRHYQFDLDPLSVIVLLRLGISSLLRAVNHGLASTRPVYPTFLKIAELLIDNLYESRMYEV